VKDRNRASSASPTAYSYWINNFSTRRAQLRPKTHNQLHLSTCPNLASHLSIPMPRATEQGIVARTLREPSVWLMSGVKFSDTTGTTGIIPLNALRMQMYMISPGACNEGMTGPIFVLHVRYVISYASVKFTDTLQSASMQHSCIEKHRNKTSVC
jgi:hypothetical protein